MVAFCRLGAYVSFFPFVTLYQPRFRAHAKVGQLIQFLLNYTRIFISMLTKAGLSGLSVEHDILKSRAGSPFEPNTNKTDKEASTSLAMYQHSPETIRIKCEKMRRMLLSILMAIPAALALERFSAWWVLTNISLLFSPL